MKVFIGSDHAGFGLKKALQEHLKSSEYEVVDLGVYTDASKADYPDLAREVAEKVRENKETLGILVCGTGIGMAIAANKLHGIRAANVHDVNEAELARMHNDANIVTVGGRTMAPELAKQIADVFLKTPFAGGRHIPRIAKITAIEDAE